MLLVGARCRMIFRPDRSIRRFVCPTSGGPAVRPDCAPSGHSRSRTSSRGRQRQHRRLPGPFFPTVTLTGSGGTESTTLEGLFAPGSQAWSFSPQIVWPIFAAGTAWHELQAVKATKLIEVASYQKAIQTAFREVADALAVQATVQTQLAANQACRVRTADLQTDRSAFPQRH